MNIKDLIVPLSLAFLITAGFNYFFRDKFTNDPTKVMQSGRSYEAPRIEQQHKPLNTEVDFYDAEHAQKEVRTKVTTKYALMTVSTDGATLEQLDFQRRVNGDVQVIPTIEAGAIEDREQRCFLLGLEERTPFYYTLDKKEDNDSFVTLHYSAKSDVALVAKKYTIYKNAPKIDLEVTLTPKTSEGVQGRLFVNAPMVKDIARTDVIQGITNQEGSLTSLKKIPKTMQLTRMYWVTPNLFGLENQYFIHALVGDKQRFTQRAYFTINNNLLSAIFEGPQVTEKTSWNMTFFMGPKESSAFAEVDERLDQTLDYGWFSGICKLLLSFLKMLYGYVHSYGWAIIILTILVKLILAPFTLKGEQAMKEAAAKSAEMQRKLKLLRQKYKDDAQRRAIEERELIKKYGLPGMGGGWRMLIQIPFFIGLARILNNSILLYKAPFLWIPNLAAKDPYYILPLICAGSMILNSGARATSGQQRFMSIGLAMFIGAVTANLAAGLALYITMNMVLTVAQTWIMKRVKS